MSYDPSEVVAFVNRETPDGFATEVTCEPDWLDAHPLGVSAVRTGDLTVRYCPQRIAEIGEGLDAEQFEALLTAVLDFPFCTGATVVLGDSTPVEILEILMLNAPESAFLLAVMADRAGTDLARFLGLDDN